MSIDVCKSLKNQFMVLVEWVYCCAGIVYLICAIHVLNANINYILYE